MADSKQLLENYLSDVIKKARTNVREESYYSLLENFLEKLGKAQGKKLQVDSSFLPSIKSGEKAVRLSI